MKDIVFVQVSQRKSDFISNSGSLARDLGIKLNIEMVDYSFGFPWNSIKYKFVLDGEETDVKRFNELVENLL